MDLENACREALIRKGWPENLIDEMGSLNLARRLLHIEPSSDAHGDPEHDRMADDGCPHA